MHVFIEFFGPPRTFNNRYRVMNSVFVAACLAPGQNSTGARLWPQHHSRETRSSSHSISMSDQHEAPSSPPATAPVPAAAAFTTANFQGTRQHRGGFTRGHSRGRGGRGRGSGGDSKRKQKNMGRNEYKYVREFTFCGCTARDKRSILTTFLPQPGKGQEPPRKTHEDRRRGPNYGGQ